MAISFHELTRVFRLEGRESLYQMQIGPAGHLLHLYFGRRAPDDFGYLYPPQDRGFSPNPYELRENRGWSLDTMPQEYSGSLTGDYRLSALELTRADGLRGTDLRYVRHEILQGKYTLDGMPSALGRGEGWESLRVTLVDAASAMTVELLYAICPELDILTRAAIVRNDSDKAVRLEKVSSACLDLPFGDWELLHFPGRHTEERRTDREALPDGIVKLSSRRTASSHQHNPSCFLCRPDTDEDRGECVGTMLVYSGSHSFEIERDQTGSVRLVAGIDPEDFTWRLEPGESFTAPELILGFSHEGLGALSRRFHCFLITEICRRPLPLEERPVLLNSWEAIYFDIDDKKLLGLAREAKELGVDMLVIDDGWFGHRDDDKTSLGDWFPHPGKLPGGMAPLLREINGLGLKVGLWVEPEMISEDSALYRNHPDWALTAPGREPAVGRSQLVLDLSRKEIRDYLYDTLAALLDTLPLGYLKWDFNREPADLYSHALPPERQGELGHRYVLGLYELMDRLTDTFPQVLIEGCAGGGGRFDAAMLAYCPQIWCSDNTDHISRLRIQHGTSFCYPISTVGAHVSSSPNHQTGRATPLHTRGVVAMSGTFGFELNPARMSETEKAEIRQQLRRFRMLRGLIGSGELYRLSDPDKKPFAAWQFVWENGSEALLNLVLTQVEANPRPLHCYLKGLEPAASYELAEAWLPENIELPADFPRKLSGAALMYAGLVLPPLYGDYPAAQLLWRRVVE